MSRSVVVLVEFQNLAQILSLYNYDNFQVPDRKMWWRNFCTAFAFMVFLLMMVVLYVAALIHCFECDFVIGDTAMAIPTSFCLLQVFSVFVSMAWNNREISKTIDLLQGIIEAGEINCGNLYGLRFYVSFPLFFTSINRKVFLCRS